MRATRVELGFRWFQQHNFKARQSENKNANEAKKVKIEIYFVLLLWCKAKKHKKHEKHQSEESPEKNSKNA